MRKRWIGWNYAPGIHPILLEPRIQDLSFGNAGMGDAILNLHIKIRQECDVLFLCGFITADLSRVPKGLELFQEPVCRLESGFHLTPEYDCRGTRWTPLYSLLCAALCFGRRLARLTRSHRACRSCGLHSLPHTHIH